MTALGQNSFAPFTREHAIDFIMQAFVGDAEPTPAAVERQVDGFLNSPALSHLSGERKAIINEIMRRTRVVIGTATALDDNRDHIEWLEAVDRDAWRAWPRLKDYLRRADHLPPAVLLEIDTSTDQALRRLEDPERPGSWDRRGLVVGHVQSGKTTHYSALAAKALDAGYQIIVILAGTHNSLRSQTHERIDRYLIGRNSAALIEAFQKRRTPERTEGLVGVGTIAQQLGHLELPFTVLTCTTSADEGDFRTAVAGAVGFQVGVGSRLVMVVKKNKSILRNLIDWLRLQHATVADTRPIPNPALVIDDEADHASINTSRDPELDPSRINALIRELLMSFRRVGFIGYTATPFANIFAYSGDGSSSLGADLFPRSFILNLKAPSDYIGPSLVFGHPGDEAEGIPEQQPLPMHISVKDAGQWVPERHTRAWVPGPMPESAREAIRLFILVCAARAARGQVGVHNSMLVHATRFIDVQDKISKQVQDQVDALRNVIGLGHRYDVDKLYAVLRNIWLEHITRHHPTFAARLGERCPALPLWDDVWDQVAEVLQHVRVMRISGDSTDALAYSRTEGGLTAIAIGGDKLSRGLTLEGLSVSYFLRSSQMFDTLMQMGRWFGYRPGYPDLCRVYTTDALHHTFREIALATDELRDHFDYMAAVGKTPEDFGLRVREPSDGLVITAANKILSGENVTVRFAGTLVQTLEIDRVGRQAMQNLAATTDLLVSLGGADNTVRGHKTPHSLWHDIEADRVLAFLQRYEAIATPSFYNNCETLRRYISQQLGRRELRQWTIAVVGKATSKLWHVGTLRFPMVSRAAREDHPTRFITQAVVGSADEGLDLSTEEWSQALSKSSATTVAGQRRTIPERKYIREVRPANRGLLLIYPLLNGIEDVPIPAIAISFPDSQTARALSYRVNQTWVQQRGLVAEAEDDEAT